MVPDPSSPHAAPGPRDRALELLRRVIAEGGVPAGAELPSSRELGRILGIPHATVFRAMRELEATGAVERTAWGGRRVAGSAPALGGTAPGAIAGATLVMLLGEGPSEWADPVVIGVLERLVEIGARSLLLRLRQLRPGDLEQLVAGLPDGVVIPGADLAWDETLPVIARLRAAGVAVVCGGGHPDLGDVDAVLRPAAPAGRDGAKRGAAMVDLLQRRRRGELPPGGRRLLVPG